MLELEKNEKDLVILGHLQQHWQTAEMNKEFYAEEQDQHRSRTKDKEKLDQMQMKFFFGGLTICRKIYFFINVISEKMYKNIKKHFEEKRYMKSI